jgi:hypothetical protein
VLPNRFAWLVHLIPETERFGADVCWLLRQPEIMALINEVPQAGRFFRPLCRMFGVEPPSALHELPAWLRPAPEAAPPPPPPPPVDDAICPLSRAGEQVWKFHPRNRGDPPNRD